MTEIILIPPTPDYAQEIMSFRSDLLDSGDSFAGCGGLSDCTDAKAWLNLLASRENQETCPAGGVPSSTYLAVRACDNTVVGIIDLRHHINHPILSTWGGHMGYSVRPSERRKGYAKEMLRLNLQNCKTRGLSKVLITCDHDNLASEKTILANGGIFEKEILIDGERIKRYWIHIPL